MKLTTRAWQTATSTTPEKRIASEGRRSRFAVAAMEGRRRKSGRLEGRLVRKVRRSVDQEVERLVYQPYKVPARPGKKLEGWPTSLAEFLTDLVAFLADRSY
ncbi:HTH domain-containing protein [Sesbania bispinosa]|nr:HTH domain-containing protein [Sesbania bispinosa]